jgi:hypothetical protein
MSALCRSGRRVKEGRPLWEAAFLFMAIFAREMDCVEGCTL